MRTRIRFFARLLALSLATTTAVLAQTTGKVPEQNPLATFSRCDSSDDIRAISHHLFGME